MRPPAAATKVPKHNITMDFVTNEKLTIVGAAGMIGSNMAQTALMMRLTPNICLYDPYEPALEGVAEELYHCAPSTAATSWSALRRMVFRASSSSSSPGRSSARSSSAI